MKYDFRSSGQTSSVVEVACWGFSPGLGPSHRILRENGAAQNEVVFQVVFPLPSCYQTKCRSSMESPVIMGGGGMRTKPLIPEMCFATTTEEDSECDKPPATPYLEEDGTSLLISCSSCSIRVHTSQCMLFTSEHWSVL